MVDRSHEQINNLFDVIGARIKTAVEKDDTGFGITIASIGTGFVTVLLAAFVIGGHADGYRAAGVPGEQATVGAIVAQVFVAAVTVTAVLLLRAGRLVAARTVAIAAAGLLFLFAVLPHVVGGSSWLTTLLGVLTALLLQVLVGAVAVVLSLLSQ